MQPILFFKELFVISSLSWSFNTCLRICADPDVFKPLSWLGDNPRFCSDQQRALQPFPAGPRNCIGQSLVNAKTRLASTNILGRLEQSFNMHLNQSNLHYKVYDYSDSSSMLSAGHRRDRTAYRAFPLVFIDMKR